MATRGFFEAAEGIAATPSAFRLLPVPDGFAFNTSTEGNQTRVLEDFTGMITGEDLGNMIENVEEDNLEYSAEFNTDNAGNHQILIKTEQCIFIPVTILSFCLSASSSTESVSPSLSTLGSSSKNILENILIYIEYT